MHSYGSTVAPDADEERLRESTDSTGEVESDNDDDASSERAEEVDPKRVLSSGVPRLRSELGRWAQRAVRAEEWLEERLSEKFVVDNSHLRALTVGVAWRLSKKADEVNHCDRSIDGPYWGSTIVGVDQGDGWVKVGRRYLPTHLDGQLVLMRASEYHHHDQEASPASANSLDSDGVVHEFSPSSGHATWCRAEQLKSFHWRKGARRSPRSSEEFVLCPDQGGKVCIYLYLDDHTARMERMRRKRAALRRLQGAPSPFGVFSTDEEGVVQEWL